MQLYSPRTAQAGKIFLSALVPPPQTSTNLHEPSASCSSFSGGYPYLCGGLVGGVCFLFSSHIKSRRRGNREHLRHTQPRKEGWGVLKERKEDEGNCRWAEKRREEMEIERGQRLLVDSLATLSTLANFHPEPVIESALYLALGMDLERFQEVVGFLEEAGLVEVKSHRIQITELGLQKERKIRGILERNGILVGGERRGEENA